MPAGDKVLEERPAPTAPSTDGAAAARPSVSMRDRSIPRSFVRLADGTNERDLGPRQIAELLKDEAAMLWVDVDTTNRHQIAVLENVFHFHPLAIEDTLNANTRVKIEEYNGYFFLVVRGVRFVEETGDPYDLETFNIYFFIGKNFLVTVHGEYAPAVTDMMARLDRSPELLNRGVAKLAHGIMDASVDAYFPVVDQLDEFVDGLEQRVFVEFDQSALRDIFSVKRLVLSLRRHLSPQREVLNILTNRPTSLLTPEVQVYFRDVYDHVLRINDALETYRELLSSTLDSYLTQVSNRLGQTSKALSVVATITLPFVIISGMWGMNFDVIPLAHTAHGFWTLLAVQLFIGLLLLVILRWRKIL